MTIEEELEALKEEILLYFPTVHDNDDSKKVVFIRKSQEYLSEILLQMKRTLERKLLSETFNPKNKTHQTILADFASFCIAFSLAGKSKTTIALKKRIIDKELYESLDRIFKKIYDTHSHLVPEQKLSSEDYEKGLCQKHRCCDLIGEGVYIFIPGKENHLFTTITTMNKYHSCKIQNIIIMLDPNYDANNPSVPLKSPATGSPSPSSSNDKFAETTEDIFKKGMFESLGKERSQQKSVGTPRTSTIVNAFINNGMPSASQPTPRICKETYYVGPVFFRKTTTKVKENPIYVPTTVYTWINISLGKGQPRISYTKTSN